MNTQKIGEASYDLMTNTMETVKNHPAVTALVGLGISWFLADNFFKQKNGSQIIDQLQEKVAQLEEQARQYAESNLPDLKESAKETGESISLESKSVLEGVSSYMNENPLMSGFIGLSAGLILGILTSGLLSQNGLLEETKQDVQKKTRQILHKARRKAGHITDEARQAGSMS
jgi:ElaB/YqjD/DUF883 family membrane-anchored ribosome-binding protein